MVVIHSRPDFDDLPRGQPKWERGQKIWPWGRVDLEDLTSLPFLVHLTILAKIVLTTNSIPRTQAMKPQQQNKSKTRFSHIINSPDTSSRLFGMKEDFPESAGLACTFCSSTVSNTPNYSHYTLSENRSASRSVTHLTPTSMLILLFTIQHAGCHFDTQNTWLLADVTLILLANNIVTKACNVPIDWWLTRVTTNKQWNNIKLPPKCKNNVPWPGLCGYHPTLVLEVSEWTQNRHNQTKPGAAAPCSTEPVNGLGLHHVWSLQYRTRGLSGKLLDMIPKNWT